MADDLAQIATALYAVLPGDFIRARDARAKEVRAAGERELATAVKTLRRPTVAGWLVNLLAHEPGALDPLVSLGERLRDAQSHLDITALKELSAERPGLIRALTDEAARLATAADSGFSETAATREQVAATLTAALADPLAEQAVVSGRLVSALAYAGFGEVEIGDAVATPLRPVRDPAPGRSTPAEPPEDGAEEADLPEPEADPGPSAAQIGAAEAAVTKAEEALEVAEASLAQARARRAAARRTLDAAVAAWEDLQDRT